MTEAEALEAATLISALQDLRSLSDLKPEDNWRGGVGFSSTNVDGFSSRTGAAFVPTWVVQQLIAQATNLITLRLQSLGVEVATGDIIEEIDREFEK